METMSAIINDFEKINYTFNSKISANLAGSKWWNNYNAKALWFDQKETKCSLCIMLDTNNNPKFYKMQDKYDKQGNFKYCGVTEITLTEFRLIERILAFWGF